MSDDFFVGGLPGGGGQLGDAIDRPVAQSGQDVIKIGPQVDVQTAAGFHDGGDGRNFGTGGGAAQMDPVFAAQSQGAHRALAPVVVHFHRAVGQKDFQPAPLAQSVVASLGQFPPGGSSWRMATSRVFKAMISQPIQSD